MSASSWSAWQARVGERNPAGARVKGASTGPALTPQDFVGKVAGSHI